MFVHRRLLIYLMRFRSGVISRLRQEIVPFLRHYGALRDIRWEIAGSDCRTGRSFSRLGFHSIDCSDAWW